MNNMKERMLEEVDSQFHEKKIRASLAAKVSYLKQFYKPTDTKFGIDVHKNYNFAGWKGAALYSDKEKFKNKFITKALFEEYGDSIVRRNYYTFDLN